ncbi:hypothetical protein [Mucilaginibacter oryzae]|uniref:hypothetical protein n=1 Tax=Mucilaginibacter oryzae TaxID=468058 RepID=UPI0011B20BAD|nr:hypothetical protein [Mucilaginibacter oryzae]
MTISVFYPDYHCEICIVPSSNEWWQRPGPGEGKCRDVKFTALHLPSPETSGTLILEGYFMNISIMYDTAKP